MFLKWVKWRVFSCNDHCALRTTKRFFVRVRMRAGCCWLHGNIFFVVPSLQPVSELLDWLSQETARSVLADPELPSSEINIAHFLAGGNWISVVTFLSIAHIATRSGWNKRRTVFKRRSTILGPILNKRRTTAIPYRRVDMYPNRCFFDQHTQQKLCRDPSNKLCCYAWFHSHRNTHCSPY